MDPSESEDSDVDSLTPSLEAAMPPEQRLSTQERLRLARRRRSEQLKKWGQREREWQLHIAAQNHPRERNERVTFVPNVMLLETAARNDLAEGKRSHIHFSSNALKTPIYRMRAIQNRGYYFFFTIYMSGYYCRAVIN